MMIKDIHNNEIEFASVIIEICDKCPRPILCYQTKDGSIIEHNYVNGFHLWGPFGLCPYCDHELMKEMRRLASTISEPR